jgi:hypothetical protein
MWFIFNHSIRKGFLLKSTINQINRWKDNRAFLATYFRFQGPLNTEPFDKEPRIGNTMAPLKVLIVVSPFCNACKSAVVSFLNYHHKFPDDIDLTFRFNIDPTISSKNLTAAKNILHHCILFQNKHATILHDWFSLTRIKEHENAQSNVEILNLLLKQSSWCFSNHISQTPTIFVNGIRLWEPFSATDLIKIQPHSLLNTSAISTRKL